MNDKIKCPNCGHNFDVEDALSGQLEAKIKADYEKKISEQADRFKKEELRLIQEREEFQKKKEQENEIFKKRLAKEKELIAKNTQEEMEQRVKDLQEKTEKEKERISKSIREDVEEQVRALQEENAKKKEENRALKSKEIELLKKENELKEQGEELKLTLEKQLLEKQQEIEEKARIKEREAQSLKEKEYQKQLDDQKKLIEEMKRKAEQGSMQMQGEVQELAIEEWLMAKFPLDTIEEIKKGARGGDCLQIVNTRAIQNAGMIYYESKRTKDFQPSWIEKFKADIRAKGASIGVLVTEVMPSDMDRMGLRDGVWVCTYEEFKGLCTVLRESIIQLSTALSSEENKGDKMTMLYTYLTSNTFKMQVEAIVEGFTQMKTDLDSEKRSMQRIWKQREKQIEKVVTNTVEMYGSIKGIAGKAIQSVQALELPGFEEEK